MIRLGRTVGSVLLATSIPLLAQSPTPRQLHIFVRDVSSHDVWVARSAAAESGQATINDGQGQAKTWGAYRSYASGGNYPQMPETARDFLQSCPALVVVTTDAEKADFMFLVDHERFKGITRHNKVVLVNRGGDVVWADQTRKLPNAVKDACAFLSKQR